MSSGEEIGARGIAKMFAERRDDAERLVAGIYGSVLDGESLKNAFRAARLSKAAQDFLRVHVQGIHHAAARFSLSRASADLAHRQRLAQSLAALLLPSAVRDAVLAASTAASVSGRRRGPCSFPGCSRPRHGRGNGTFNPYCRRHIIPAVRAMELESLVAADTSAVGIAEDAAPSASTDNTAVAAVSAAPEPSDAGAPRPYFSVAIAQAAAALQDELAIHEAVAARLRTEIEALRSADGVLEQASRGRTGS